MKTNKNNNNMLLNTLEYKIQNSKFNFMSFKIHLITYLKQNKDSNGIDQIKNVFKLLSKKVD